MLHVMVAKDPEVRTLKIPKWEAADRYLPLKEPPKPPPVTVVHQLVRKGHKQKGLALDSVMRIVLPASYFIAVFFFIILILLSLSFFSM